MTIDPTTWPSNPFRRRKVAVGYMQNGAMARIAREIGKCRSYVTRALASGESEAVTELAAKELGLDPQKAFPAHYENDGQHIARAIKTRAS